MKKEDVKFFVSVVLLCLFLLGSKAWASSVTQIAAGDYHTFAIENDGTLWGWGINGNDNSSQLGDGKISRGVPLQIGTDSDWKSVVGGNAHTVALKINGTLWAWGANGFGQVGDGTLVKRNNPVQIGTDSDWKAVAAADHHSIALKDDGSLWAWGYNNYGQIGDGTTANKNVPVQIAAGATWKEIAAGYGHTAAIKTDGTLWAWGRVYGTFTPSNRNVPIQISTDTDWVRIAAKGSHVVALKANGTLWAWGDNGLGQLGYGIEDIGKTTPVQIGSASDWQAVAAGLSHTIGLKTDGTIWSWGDNNYGQLGIRVAGMLSGTETSLYSPTQIGIASDWKTVATGAIHTIALKNNGDVWIWGSNSYGQLGNGAIDAIRTVPAQVAAGAEWKIAAAGHSHSAAIRTDGTLWGWGSNGYGQLGTGVGVPGNQFVPMQAGAASNWDVIAAGSQHALALQTDGSLWAWGYNGSGQLGDDTTVNKHTPIRIGADVDWQHAAAGMDTSFAIKTNGTLWAWGYNGHGQLGDGTTVNKKTPVQIASAVNWKIVSAGYLHAVAVKTDGTLWAWGYNGSGQLGDGTMVQRNSPVQIGGAADWQSAAAGYAHSTGLKQDGTLWSWGNNGAGQNSVVPVQIGTDSDWKKVAAGIQHGISYTIALKKNGTLWGWGSNAAGQLGDWLTTVAKTNPAQIGLDSDWQDIVAGGGHVVAVKNNGQIWSWGANHNGQTGDYTAVKDSPILIISTEWTVTPLTEGGGLITPSTPQTVAHNSIISFTVTPDDGYSINSVTGCGGILNGTTYTTGEIIADCTVTASFIETDSDGDGIDDAWEEHWFGNLSTADAKSDTDKDGYSDLQEYLNILAGETDPKGFPYNPNEKNAPGGTGYKNSASILPAIYLLL